MLINLTGNALKFTDKGKVTLRVALEPSESDLLSLRFSVSDTGIGVAKNKIQKLFEPFSQSDGSTTRKYGGTGLGLSISRKLTELMNGEIDATSVPGKGSTFWFTTVLPALETAQVDMIHQEKGWDRLFEKTRGSSALILHSNEEEAISFMHYFQRMGIIAHVARNLESAETILQENSDISMLFSALEMPEGSGLQNAEKLAKQGDISPSNITLLAPDAMGPPQGHGDDFRFLACPARYRTSQNIISKIFNLSLETDGNQIGLTTALDHEDNLWRSELNILLVDDNLINRKVAIGILNKIGFTADSATDGKEAVKAFTEGNYDIILMDCMMPGMDGYQATEKIRELEAGTSHVPIIAMTANAMAGDREHCLESGMDDYVAKPIKKEILEATILHQRQTWLLESPAPS